MMHLPENRTSKSSGRRGSNKGYVLSIAKDLLPLLAAIFYTITVLIGFLISVSYYRLFDINFAAYSDIADYLLLPLFHIEIVFPSLIVAIFLAVISGVPAEEFPPSRLKKGFIFTLLISVSMGIWVYAPYREYKEVKGGMKERYSVYLTGSGMMSCVTLIGKTQNFHVFWDGKSGTPIAIPLSEIRAIITVLEPKPKPGRYDTPPKPDIQKVENSEFEIELRNWQSKFDSRCGYGRDEFHSIISGSLK